MADAMDISENEVTELYERLNAEAEQSGYHLNPDVDFTRDLIEGLIINERRYGYQACPCRLASADKEDDLDIICPCDYRDPDLTGYNSCYCGLYVSQSIVDGENEIVIVPERRPEPEERRKAQSKSAVFTTSENAIPVWRCKVCGYLCARNEPPEVCPICRAKKDRFERFGPLKK